MKADLYVQGNYWATIDLPPDGLLAMLATGMITEATHKAELLAAELQHLDDVRCSISLRFIRPATYQPDTEPNP